MVDQTAFPWCPVTRWTREDRGRRTIWEVTITDPSPHPTWLNAVHAKGGTPGEAIASLLSIVAWWLDYDGRRGGNAGMVYAHLCDRRQTIARGRLGKGGPIDPPGGDEPPF